MSGKESSSKEPAIPKPSYLPPNPSVGELVTEIDRARHDAARTVTALVAKLDVRTRVRQQPAGRKVTALRARVVEATPDPVASALGTAIGYAKRVPVPARILLAVVLLRWFSARRRR